MVLGAVLFRGMSCPFLLKLSIMPSYLYVKPKLGIRPIFLAFYTSRHYIKLMINPREIRAARALLNLKQSELAQAAGISLATLNNIEREAADPRISTIRSIQKALTERGIEFIENGVRLKDE